MTYSGAIALQIAILIFTLTLVIWQPRSIGIGWIALGGVLATLAMGVVTLQDIFTLWAISWNATLTLIALVIISLILDAAGFWRGVALRLVHASLGRGRLLFCGVLLLGAMITILLTNTGTVLIWTPIVIEILCVLGFHRQAILAFAFATSFIADISSLPLPVSNWVNMITTDSFQISFLRYALVMIPVHFVAIATGISVIWFYLDQYIPPTYSLASMPPPNSAIRDSLVCQWSFPVLGLLLIAYFVAQPLGIPIAAISVCGALVMVAVAERWLHKEDTPVISLSKILREVPWQWIGFSLGMYLIVFGLGKTHLTVVLSQGLTQLSGWGLTQVAMGTGLFASILSGLMTNLPTVLVQGMAIQTLFGIDPAVGEVMVYANAIGCDIGAKISPIGSLSTLLWFDILSQKGFQITWHQYAAMAFILTIPVLFMSLLSLAIWLPWLVT